MKDSLPILLVDDDRTDVLLFTRALKRLDLACPLVRCSNGREALEYLKDPANKRPWVVLSDLNTPKMNGIDFLKAVKADETLRRTVVIILTGSSDEGDVAESFRLGAAGYMTKPSDYEGLLEMIRTIQAYWTLSESPP